MNSKSIKIIFVIIALFLSVELTLRMAQPYLSKDIKHYKALASIVEKFDKSEVDKVLFIGNSLTREGVDKEKFEKNEKGLTLIRPDDTTVTEWFWIFKSKIYDKDIKVTDLAIIFVGDQLEDKPLKEQNLVSISNIVNTSEMFSVREFEVLSLSDLITLTLSHFSVTFASRERVQRRVLDLLPMYREQSRIINRSLVEGHVQSSKDKKKATYKHLLELIKLAQEKNIHLTFISSPLLKAYTLDRDLLNIFNKSESISFINAKDEVQVDKTDFQDGYHLNKEGASKFTEYILEAKTFSF